MVSNEVLAVLDAQPFDSPETSQLKLALRALVADPAQNFDVLVDARDVLDKALEEARVTA